MTCIVHATCMAISPILSYEFLNLGSRAFKKGSEEVKSPVTQHLGAHRPNCLKLIFVSTSLCLVNVTNNQSILSPFTFDLEFAVRFRKMLTIYPSHLKQYLFLFLTTFNGCKQYAFLGWAQALQRLSFINVKDSLGLAHKQLCGRLFDYHKVNKIT